VELGPYECLGVTSSNSSAILTAGNSLSSLAPAMVAIFGIGGVVLIRTDASETKEKTRALYSHFRNKIE